VPGSTTGAYHELDFLSNFVGFKAVGNFEVRVGQRFLDLEAERVVGASARLVLVELKNLRAGSAFESGGQVLKDMKGALDRAGYPNGNVPALIRELEGFEYVLRGTPNDMQLVVRGIEAKIREALAPHGLSHLSSHVKITTLNRTLPF